jgi:hypothetical protein
MASDPHSGSRSGPAAGPAEPPAVTGDEAAAAQIREPGERGGDPVCWLHLVCPACGAIADAAPLATCPACGSSLQTG